MKHKYSAYGVGILSLVLLASGGCWTDTASTEITAPQEQLNSVPQDQRTPEQRVQLASEHLATYMKTAQRLPASTEFIQRAMMQDIFQELTTILPLIAGPDADATVRQQLHIVQSTRQQLASLPSDQSSELIVESGLRAAYDAFEDMGTTLFADQTDLPDALNALSAKLDQLDAGPGPDHRQIVADASRMIGAIMGRMTAVLRQRLQPATLPAATTMPASQP
jgi:hypothetical protein